MIQRLDGRVVADACRGRAVRIGSIKEIQVGIRAEALLKQIDASLVVPNFSTSADEWVVLGEYVTRTRAGTGCAPPGVGSSSPLT